MMLAKPGKSPDDVNSYRPISLFASNYLLFKKVLPQRLKIIIDPNQHRIIDIIEKALKEKVVFRDAAQAFDKVWHRGLVNKLEKGISKQYVEVIKSYLILYDRLFRVKQEEKYLDLMKI